MEVKQLGFLGILSYFQMVIAGMADPRSASNANRYSLQCAAATTCWAAAPDH